MSWIYYEQKKHIFLSFEFQLCCEHFEMPLNVGDIASSLPQTTFALAKLLIKLYQAREKSEESKRFCCEPATFCVN